MAQGRHAAGAVDKQQKIRPTRKILIETKVLIYFALQNLWYRATTIILYILHKVLTTEVNVTQKDISSNKTCHPHKKCDVVDLTNSLF